MRESVSIITRTKNRPKLLGRCIRSVLDQRFRDWLHVIVNDGGDAKEVENIVSQFRAEYSGRCKIVHNQRSCGRAAALNSGLRAAVSEYVAFLDDDDTWHGDFLARMISALFETTNIEAGSAICQTEIVREKLSTSDIIELKREPFNPNFVCLRLSDLTIENQFTINAIVFRRSMVDEIGSFNEKLDALEDWEFNLRFHLRYDAIVVDQALARWHWRVGNGEISYDNSIHVSGNLHKIARAQILNDAMRGKWLDARRDVLLILVLGGELNELKRALEVERRSLNADRISLEAQLHLKEIELRRVTTERDAILQSSAWRMTYPLRKSVGLFLR